MNSLSSDHIFGIGSVLTAGLGAYQSFEYHKENTAIEDEQHQIEMKFAFRYFMINNLLRILKEQHRREMMLAKQTYLISTFTELEQYCQELNENLINGSKDAERDMADQRNQQYQTILIAATIMITALVNVLIQGVLPINATTLIKISYSISNSAALLFLFLTAIFCIEVTSRVNKFMYKRSLSNLNHLSDAMNHTRNVMYKINEQRKIRISSDSDTSESNKQNDDKNNTNGKISHKDIFPKISSFRSSRSISKLSDKDVENEWLNHENEVHQYLQRRGKIDERVEMLTGENTQRIPFEEFWDLRCKSLGQLSLLFFYIGTSSMLIAVMTFMWAQYQYVYNNNNGAIVAVTTIGFSLLLSLILALYLRLCDNQLKRLRNYQDNENNNHNNVSNKKN